MLYRVLADAIVAVHLGFIVFVVLGGLLALRWRRMPRLHLPAVLWAAASELFGCSCPLTPLEGWLRRASGAGGYSGGYIEHYLLPIIYPAALTREVQFVLAGLVVIVNLAAYAFVWWHRRRVPSQ